MKADIQGQSDALTGELLFHFKTREHRWRPFLAGGAGAKQYIIAGPEPFPQPIPQVASLTANDVWKVVFSAGGGVKFRLAQAPAAAGGIPGLHHDFSQDADRSRPPQHSARNLRTIHPAIRSQLHVLSLTAA